MLRAPCQLDPSFNGAALVGVRRDGNDLTAALGNPTPSTEPHSLECGEQACLHPSRNRRKSFNGAALVGVRRVCRPATSVRQNGHLQRSRTRWSAERRLGNTNSNQEPPPSTEPHSLECGENQPPTTPRHDRRTFNGAALVGVRRVWRCPAGTPEGAPSTEPHSLECGEGRRRRRGWRRRSAFNGAALVGVRRGSRTSKPLPRRTTLQRSRTRWSAESNIEMLRALVAEILQRSRTRWSAERGSGCCRRHPDASPFNGAALVGVRRDARQRRSANGGRDPSTEPHSLECGESASSATGENAVAILQRSRTRWSAERWPISRQNRRKVTNLQRSRTRWSAESACDLRTGLEFGEPSTEPHSLECGEKPRKRPPATIPPTFNGAALVGVRRDYEQGDSHGQPNALQRSRTRWSAESYADDHIRACEEILQRSRTRWSAER